MIVWLASYPRSGNTALRAILYRAFGVHTHSMYDDKTDIGSRHEMSEAVGHLSHNLDPETFYAQATETDKRIFIKTHDAPPDDAKAIYVVRDGRSAIISYFHYLKHFSAEDTARTSVADITLGECYFGSWSDHFDAWSPYMRKNTLLIKYQDIAKNPAAVIKELAAFIGLPVLNSKLTSFEELQKIDSEFFRSGSDKRNIAELEGNNLDLFWFMHGELMVNLGYTDKVPSYNSNNASNSIRRSLTAGRRELAEKQRQLIKASADIAAHLNVIQTYKIEISALEAAHLDVTQNYQTKIKALEAARLDVIHNYQMEIKALEAAHLDAIQNYQTKIKALEAAHLDVSQNYQTKIRALESELSRTVESRWWRLGEQLTLTPKVKTKA